MHTIFIIPQMTQLVKLCYFFGFFLRLVVFTEYLKIKANIQFINVKKEVVKALNIFGSACEKNTQKHNVTSSNDVLVGRFA